MGGGPNLRAIRQVSLSVDTLAGDALPGLVQVATIIRPAELTPKNGAIVLGPVLAASPILQKADAAVAVAQQQLASIDRSELATPIRTAVEQFSGKLDTAAGLTSTAARVARLLPPMLGTGQPRTYLLVLQNLAEVRSTGGIFGSYVVMRADKGKISLVTQAAARTLIAFDPPVATVPNMERRLYGSAMAIFPPTSTSPPVSQGPTSITRTRRLSGRFINHVRPSNLPDQDQLLSLKINFARRGGSRFSHVERCTAEFVKGARVPGAGQYCGRGLGEIGSGCGPASATAPTMTMALYCEARGRFCGVSHDFRPKRRLQDCCRESHGGFGEAGRRAGGDTSTAPAAYSAASGAWQARLAQRAIPGVL